MAAANGNLQTWLTTLGQAHKDGAFSADATRYPWLAAEPKVIPFGPRRHAWVRVVGPLVAAAAVAVLFVGPALFETPKAADVAERTVIPDQPQGMVVVDSAPVSAAETEVDCDFDGNGVFNGLDVQAMQLRVSQSSDEDVLRWKDALVNCLLH